MRRFELGILREGVDRKRGLFVLAVFAAPEVSP
jgi:hypothetical protein